MPRRKRKDSESSESQYDPDADDNSTPDDDDDDAWKGGDEGEDDDVEDDDEEEAEPKKPRAKASKAAKKTSAAAATKKQKPNHGGPNTEGSRIPKERYSEDGYLVDENGKRTYVTPANRRTWKRKVIVVDEEELSIPSSARRTANGGYAATSVHRAKISKANAGNVPWNFGRHRSGADKAKIAAGVRAKNRERLLKQLDELNMTEEEWESWKKKIKLLRNNVLRIRSNNNKAKSQVDFFNKRLKEHQDKNYKQEHSKKMKNLEPIIKHEVKYETESDSEEEGEKIVEDLANAEDKKNDAEEVLVIEEPRENEVFKLLQEEEEEDIRIQELFGREVTWRPFSFAGSGRDVDDSNDTDDYIQTCPTGGPGGLICCQACSDKYGSFLSQTIQDLETQRMRQEVAETKEIMQLLEGDEREMAESVERTSVGLEQPNNGDPSQGSYGMVPGTRNGREKIYYL